jgi:hypothetical protein
LNLVKLISTVLSDPAVRAIVIPLAEEVISWIRSGRPVPGWLDLAEVDVKELQAPLALERAKLRREAAERETLRRAAARLQGR